MDRGDLFHGTLVRLAARQPDDLDTFARWSQDPEYARLVDTDIVRPQSVEETAAGPNNMAFGSTSISFRLRTLADDTLIGFVALFNIEWNNGACIMAIGIGDPANRGKGYGADALRLILGYAFNELNLYRVGLDVIGYNERAIRAYLRAGFVREGAMRGAVHRDGQRSDRVIMGILRDEWLAMQRSASATGAA